VTANVAGEPLELLVDTGSARSILPAEFARRHKLARGSASAGENIFDANGRLTYMPLLPNVPVQFEGEATAGKMDFLMNPAPDAHLAVLAPQELVRPGWAVVIDLGHQELRYEREESALQRLTRDGSSPRELEFSRCVLAEGPFYRNHRLVPVLVNGVRTEMMVDTGATRTMLARNNPALPSMMSLRGDVKTTKALNSDGNGLVIEGVPVVFADTTFSFPILVLPTSQRCGKGMLGADVLRSCTVVWGWSALWFACHPPAR
jgi:hypothetical protein